MKVKVLIASIVCLLICTACDNQALLEPYNSTDNTDYLFTVPAGATTKQIARSLEEETFIKSAYAFTAVVKKLEFDGKLQAGDYMIKKSMTPQEIAEKLARGDIYIDDVRVTIPEGFEFVEIVDLLTSEGLIDETRFIELAESYPFEYRFLEDDRQYIHRLEGFLFPATYQMARGADELTILTKLLDTFDQRFTDEYYTRAAELGFTVNEIVTLASVIERETVVADERSKVSSVFHNRLADDYLLQADSTVQYITKERKEKMLNQDISIDSPYNSYKTAGLPPSPICSPSQAAIEAALYPLDSDLYYFVVTGDRDGRHNFSESYQQHLKYKNEAEAKLKEKN